MNKNRRGFFTSVAALLGAVAFSKKTEAVRNLTPNRVFGPRDVPRDAKLYSLQSGAWVLEPAVFRFNPAEGWFERYVLDEGESRRIGKPRIKMRMLVPMKGQWRAEPIKERVSAPFQICNANGAVLYRGVA